MAELLYKYEAYEIAGAAMDVYHQLGVGFLEPVYQESLAIELSRRNIPFQREAPFSIFYKGHELNKKYIADFICCEAIVVELKALPRISNIEVAQLINYLKVTRNRVGMLINFGSRPRMEWKRFVI
ncbi:MAG: GxxExxY protein [Acidobacteria bacterium]|nr:GxxExxY protein [Acidobacteriota bacterium]